ncbi:DUF2490 domain-containing protein [Flavobacterium branchiarum]|uniref:DUF2490 domain-containing protein n=1 Tax=Flavobacterium branchiarum TaxID=1114870 RepID=A0ABV5FSA3_9FLAO|nr:DUF2490 domain-containing protein [Flavobacterium branchiarum]MDN3673510.1 DUF2490 domain-containing protein [Flavobacterium branchiarum]
MLLRLPFFTLFSVIVLLFSTTLSAQTQNTFSGWNAVFFTYKLDNKFSIHFDGQVRSTDKLEDTQSFIARAGLNYNIKSNMIATIGYAYIGNNRTVMDIDGWVPEHRIWEQFIFNQQFTAVNRPLSLQHRFRLEQRFMGQPTIDQNELVTDSYDFAQRLRYFTRSIFPLSATNTFTNGAFVALQNEVFVNVENAPNGKFFDQNRAYLAIGWRLSPKFDIEAGYMNQFVLGKNNNTVNNIVQLAAYVRL